METLFIGYGDGLVRTSVNGGVEHRKVIDGVLVQTVAVDPNEHDRVYAATLGRGLLRSNDGGVTFERVPSVSHDVVWSVVVSESDRCGNHGAVYVGAELTAVYRSGDGGESFAELPSVQDLPEKPTWSFPPAPHTHHVQELLVSPHDPGIVMFGVELGGVYRSVDQGESWELTDADPDPHMLRAHPMAEGRMYQGGGAAYYESRDAGASWRRNLEGVPDEVRYFYGLAVDPGDPDNVLLGAARDPMSGHGVIPGTPVWSSVYRLTDGVWREVTEGLPPADGTAMGIPTSGGPGEFFYVTEPGDVFQSTDGGASFEQVFDDPARPRGDDPNQGPVQRRARSVLVVR